MLIKKKKMHNAPLKKEVLKKSLRAILKFDKAKWQERKKRQQGHNTRLTLHYRPGVFRLLGWGLREFSPMSQLCPVKPWAQVQLSPRSVCSHAPFTHGRPWHSGAGTPFWWHSTPWKPASHSQRYMWASSTTQRPLTHLRGNTRAWSINFSPILVRFKRSFTQS